MRRALQRLSNASRRFVAGLPLTGAVVFPGVQNDLYRTIASLYWFAGRHAEGRRVLDVKSGTGFGAAILVQVGARQVVAVDRHETNVAYAKRAFSLLPVEFRVDESGDLGSFDLIVAFHPEDHDVVRLAQLLEPKGKLLVGVAPGERARWSGAIREKVERLRTIVHLPPPSTRPDLASPFPSALEPSLFRFREIGLDEDPPGEAITVLLLAESDERVEAERIHVGSGAVSLEGWMNIDNQPYPGVDRVLDVTSGLPFRNARFIFAEHFIEHLPLDDALRFLAECRSVLRDEGVLRLSTPNLDWVLATHYHRGLWRNEGDAIVDCFQTNRAFRGWGHQFLYNIQTLTAALRRAGFARVEVRRYGESPHEDLRGLERHETWEDSEELPHILVIEASGSSVESTAVLDQRLGEYLRDLGVR
ncbi:MAG TPA: methyltransferase domain-containing protein [Thermoanaerobaculia bacterium]|nr:methyltransferase domain-containing protein [Thermoanaerobaculia bacterium]